MYVCVSVCMPVCMYVSPPVTHQCIYLKDFVATLQMEVIFVDRKLLS